MTLSFVVFCLIWSAILGACYGGFAAVAEFRAVARISLLRRSQCPNCEVPLRLWEILPIVGWFLVRGRCRACRSRIPVRDLATEASATAFFLVASTVVLTISNAEFEALQRIGVGLGVSALVIGLGVIRRARAKRAVLPRRACAVGLALSLGWLAATPLNPLALIARESGLANENDAVLSFIVISALWANIAVLAFTVAFERDLRANPNQGFVTLSKFAGNDDAQL